MPGKRRGIITVAIVGLLAAIMAFIALVPTGPRMEAPTGYEPFRDDALAAKYRPAFECPAEFGPILALYYRAARDGSGLVHIAYHPVWARERNDAPGFKPALSRSLYTGGLSLQRLMFGKGDIESVGLTLDPKSGDVVEVAYETAAGYNPSDFSVKHESVVVKGPLSLPIGFRVVSWNHLFSLEKAGGAPLAGSASAIPLSYFTPEIWREYGMWKDPETRLRKDRAHFEWERGAAGE
jgi:hypothetical protein